MHLNVYYNTLKQHIPWVGGQSRISCNSSENVNILTGLYKLMPDEIGSKEVSYIAHNLNLFIPDFTLDKQGIKYILGTRACFNPLQA